MNQIKREELGDPDLADTRTEEADVAAKFPIGSVYVAYVLSFDLERQKVSERHFLEV
jgi:hypothetical protein